MRIGKTKTKGFVNPDIAGTKNPVQMGHPNTVNICGIEASEVTNVGAGQRFSTLGYVFVHNIHTGVYSSNMANLRFRRISSLALVFIQNLPRGLTPQR
jgi:hypothetical protein